MGYAVMTYFKNLLKKYSWVSSIITWITVALIVVVIYIAPARAEVSSELHDACLRGEWMVDVIHHAREGDIPPDYVLDWLVRKGHNSEIISNFIIMIYYQFPDKDLAFLSSDFLDWCLNQRDKETL